MTTRKPKLDLLYATESSTPWLQLAVVTTDQNSSQQHARRWQAARFLDGQPNGADARISRKH